MTPQHLGGFLQESAGRHARELGVPMERLAAEGVAWVLRRLRVESRRQCTLGEELTVETWPSRFAAATAHREFVVLDGAGEPVAAATSQWVVVHLGSRSVVRLPPYILAVAATERAPEVTLGAGKLPAVEHCDLERAYEVRRGDLDVVDHVNNTRFIQWVTETVPDEVWSGCRLESLEIVYLGEGRYGDRIVARSRELEEEQERSTRWAHALSCGDRQLAQAVTTWTR